MNFLSAPAVLAALAALLGGPTIAQPHAGGASAPAVAAAPQAEPAQGEVRRVDKEAGKLTLRHGEIRNLEMPPMTMVFGVRDRSLLERVKAGDKVRFQAIQDAGAYVVTELEVIR